MDELPATDWIGRYEVSVVGYNGYPVGTLGFVLRRDTVTVELGSRNLAVHDRQDLRDWLSHPHPDFEGDDLVWSMQAQELTLTVDRATPFALPDWLITDLSQSV